MHLVRSKLQLVTVLRDQEGCVRRHGRVLARAWKVLNDAAVRLETFYLDSFFGSEVEDFLQDDLGSQKVSSGPWFRVADGIEWFDTMERYVRAHSDQIEDWRALFQEFGNFKAILLNAGESGDRWHLGLDLPVG